MYIARPDYPNDTDEIRDWLSVLPKDFRQVIGRETFVMHLIWRIRQGFNKRVNKRNVRKKTAKPRVFCADAASKTCCYAKQN